jgi:glycosyltransferase involved in cell wall biosynthesis
MRVGLSLLTLVPGISGGSETYVRELARALGRVGRHQYGVLLPSIAPDVDGLPAEVVEEYRASRSLPGRLVAMAEGRARGRRLRRRYESLDVVHFPLTILIPRIRARPVVSSILDVQHEYHPEFFSRAERSYRRLAYGEAARRSQLVVTLSEHAAVTIADRLGVPQERIRAIPLGIDHDLFRPSDDPHEQRERFLLYPAREWPHKNHALLFDAFAELRRRHPELELVLTAYAGPVPEGVRSLGRVSREELARLYRTASALVFPSLFEGFGQPPLEAMACGCPVACSNVASLPEVVADAARLFDPTSAEELIAAVEDVLADPEPWVRRGLARAAEFTWERTARLHDDVYDAVA